MEEAKDKKTLFNFIIQFLMLIIIIGFAIFITISTIAWHIVNTNNEPNLYVEESFESRTISELNKELLLTFIYPTITIFIAYKIASHNKKELLLKKSFYVFMGIIYLIFFILIIINSYKRVNFLTDNIELMKNIETTIFFPTPKMVIKRDELEIKYQSKKLYVAPISYIAMNMVFYIDKRRLLKKNNKTNDDLNVPN